MVLVGVWEAGLDDGLDDGFGMRIFVFGQAGVLG